MLQTSSVASWSLIPVTAMVSLVICVFILRMDTSIHTRVGKMYGVADQYKHSAKKNVKVQDLDGWTDGGGNNNTLLAKIWLRGKKGNKYLIKPV